MKIWGRGLFGRSGAGIIQNQRKLERKMEGESVPEEYANSKQINKERRCQIAY